MRRLLIPAFVLSLPLIISLSAGISLPPIAYIIVGLMIASGGAVLVGRSELLPPPVATFIKAIGWSLITLGFTIILWIVFGRTSLYIFGAGAVIAVIIVLWELISRLRQVM